MERRWLKQGSMTVLGPSTTWYVDGRLLFWDHLQDQVSYLLTLHTMRGSLWCKELGHLHSVHLRHQLLSPMMTMWRKSSLTSTWHLRKKNHLRSGGWRASDELGRFSIFLHLSTEAAHSSSPSFNDFDDLTKELMQENGEKKNLGKEEPARRQATTHISISSDEVLASTGDQRQNWLDAAKKKSTIWLHQSPSHPGSPLRRSKNCETWPNCRGELHRTPCEGCLDHQARRIQGAYRSLQQQNQWRLWTDYNNRHRLCNVPLHSVLALPQKSKQTGTVGEFIEQSMAPSLWSTERTSVMKNLSFRAMGEKYCVRLSQIHCSLCIITKESDLLSKPELLHSGLTDPLSSSRESSRHMWRDPKGGDLCSLCSSICLRVVDCCESMVYGAMMTKKTLQVGSHELSCSIWVETFDSRRVCYWQTFKSEAFKKMRSSSKVHRKPQSEIEFEEPNVDQKR